MEVDLISTSSAKKLSKMRRETNIAFASLMTANSDSELSQEMTKVPNKEQNQR